MRGDTGEERQMSELDEALDRLGAAISGLIASNGGENRGTENTAQARVADLTADLLAAKDLLAELA